MNRQEHLEWAKKRALAEINRTSGFAGWVAFKHDLQKHEELADHIAIELGDQMLKIGTAGMFANSDALRIFDVPGPMNMRKFIEGFN